MDDIVIGLEIHARLKTETKMFCRCKNEFDVEKPNKNVCPICLGHPGTLPTINRKAVEGVLKLGMVLNGKLNEVSKFDRKSYFYPDLPKGYQISQYDKPLVLGGELRGVPITRIHLEEDTGRLLHSTHKASEDKEYSLVDFNRAGTPLMELVTEPAITSGRQAADFARSLQQILRSLEISSADMEKGEMRVEVNLSLKNEKGETGTKIEIKNLNSFKAVEDAVEYEVYRQQEVLASGKKIVQATYGWDDVKQKTVPQRFKEEAHDYRYLPEPDLPPMELSEFDLDVLRAEIPEMPDQKCDRFMDEYKLTHEQAEVLITDKKLAQYFEESASELDEETGVGELKKSAIQTLFNYLTSDLRGILNEKGKTFADTMKITPENFADLVNLVVQKKVSSRGAKDLLARMYEEGGDPRDYLEREGLSQVSDTTALQATVDNVLAGNPNAIADYKKGKGGALQFLIGQAMKELKGQGNPEILKGLFEVKLR